MFSDGGCGSDCGSDTTPVARSRESDSHVLAEHITKASDDALLEMGVLEEHLRPKVFCQNAHRAPPHHDIDAVGFVVEARGGVVKEEHYRSVDGDCAVVDPVEAKSDGSDARCGEPCSTGAHQAANLKIKQINRDHHVLGVKREDLIGEKRYDCKERGYSD